MIGLIDYGAGNVRSVYKALTALGADVQLTRDAGLLGVAEKVVLPGVGAFGDCMANLRRLGLIRPIRNVVGRGTPFLGICVGMQVLFEEGEEMGRYDGLALLPGRVVRFDLDPPFKVPHTGWNQIEPWQDSPLLRDLPEGAWAYFNHAYYCDAQPEHTLAVTDYGAPFPCAVGHDQIYGVQFHPEKSQQVGLQVLENFLRLPTS
jgi:glutamine amidotransferase